MINSKMKGKRGEASCVKFLREHGFDSARRGVQYSGGPDSPDVVGVPALRLYDALDQSKRDAGKYEIPVVFHRRKGKKWCVVLDAEDFIDLYKLSGIGIGD